MTMLLSNRYDLGRPTLSGVSADSEELLRKIKSSMQQNSETITSPSRWKDDLKEDVIDILEECEEDDWDGYGAKPVNIENELRIQMILDLLPYYLLPPEIVPEPDGYLAFEWRRDDVALSVTVEPSKLIYAAILGAGSTRYGEDPFYGDDLPEAIKDILITYFLNV